MIRITMWIEEFLKGISPLRHRGNRGFSGLGGELIVSECFCSGYRQDAAKRQTAGIVFTHRPKIRFFAPQGRLVAPIQVKLCSTDGHRGPLGCAKFHVNRCRGVGMRPPKYQIFPLFGKESPRRGDSLDRFPKFLGAFIRLTILR